MKAGFELFQHTADIGVRVRAQSPEELLLPAAQGLYSVIGSLVPAEDLSQSESFGFRGQSQAVMLRDFLAELLFQFDAQHRILTEVHVDRFDNKELSGQVTLALVDDQRSEYQREVKAITYHELELKQEQIQSQLVYHAVFIVDI